MQTTGPHKGESVNEARVYCGEEPSERREWREVRQRFGVRRPHDDPAYLDLMSPRDARARMFYYAGDGFRVMYPFHLCALDSAIVGREFSGHSIIISPYGYGGPLLQVDDDCANREDVATGWRAAWASWMRDNSVVTEFVREDLHGDRLLTRGDGARVLGQQNVIVDLTLDPAARWQSYSAKVRKNVKRARQHELSVEFSIDDDALTAFCGIYYETMDRRQASDEFYLDCDALRTYIEETRSAGEAVIALVMQETQVVSTELVLLGSDEAYSFLGGTRAEAFPMRPNDLLKHEVCEWGHSAGLGEYVLGGGLQPDDGIFRYKLAFAPYGVADFFTRRVVADQEVYDWILAYRVAASQADGGIWIPRPGYFPAFLG